MGAGWYFFWFFLVSDEPKNHRCIRQAEIQYIETNRPKIQAQSGIPPYFLILKCPAVWTIMACDFANGWGLFVLLNDGPTFVDKVLNQDIFISLHCTRGDHNIFLMNSAHKRTFMILFLPISIPAFYDYEELN